MRLSEGWEPAEIASRSVEAMWRDPFWQVRFGERGRSYALQDAGHHLTWLSEALQAGDPEVFSRYSLWLRGVLTTRGMCSLHLSDQLNELGHVLDALGLDAQGEARRVLDHARAALRHPEGEAGELDRAAEALAREAAAMLCASDGAERTACELDLRQHLSYLADALSHGRPELFEAHLQFVRDHPESQRAPSVALSSRVGALASLLEARQLRAARAALGSGA
jgi:hypothetical protein